MTRRPPLRWIVVAGLSGAVVGGLGVFAAGQGDDGSGSDLTAGQQAPPEVRSNAGDPGWHGALLTRPEPRPAFALTDTAGVPYDFAQRTAGQLTLLFFGYTSCPDVCPIHMATLSTALEQPGMPDPVVVFVTTDPARDTPEQLRAWLDNFGTDFVGLTGTPDEIARAEAAAGVERSFVISGDGSPATTSEAGDYEVGHAAQIIAYAPDDLAYLVYPFGVRRDDWVADLPRLADGFEPQPS